MNSASEQAASRGVTIVYGDIPCEIGRWFTDDKGMTWKMDRDHKAAFVSMRITPIKSYTSAHWRCFNHFYTHGRYTMRIEQQPLKLPW